VLSFQGQHHHWLELVHAQGLLSSAAAQEGGMANVDLMIFFLFFCRVHWWVWVSWWPQSWEDCGRAQWETQQVWCHQSSLQYWSCRAWRLDSAASAFPSGLLTYCQNLIPCVEDLSTCLSLWLFLIPLSCLILLWRIICFDWGLYIWVCLYMTIKCVLWHDCERGLCAGVFQCLLFRPATDFLRSSFIDSGR
jgi:hypothetical protein